MLHGEPEQGDQNRLVPAEMVAEHRVRAGDGSGIYQPDHGLHGAGGTRRRAGQRGGGLPAAGQIYLVKMTLAPKKMVH